MMIEKLSNLSFRLRIGLTVLTLVLFLIFLLQNTSDLRIEFLVFEGRIPGAILVLVTSGVGFVFGVLTTLNTQRTRRKRHKQKLEEKAGADTN